MFYNITCSLFFSRPTKVLFQVVHLFGSADESQGVGSTLLAFRTSILE
jgi:hypothetical protein